MSEIDKTGEGSLSLAYINNNSSSKSSVDSSLSDSHKKTCPNLNMVVTGVSEYEGVFQEKSFWIGCNHWDCPVCGPKKKHAYVNDRTDAYDYFYKHHKGAGYSRKWLFKFLRLSCPGQEYRETHTPVEAFMDMTKAWNKLNIYLRKKYGKDFEYDLVPEPHKSGYPHFHVVLMGKAIAPKEIYEEIDGYWRCECGMGFTWIESFEDIDEQGFLKTVRYMGKYLSKTMMEGVKFFGKKKRLIRASQGLNKIIKEVRAERKKKFTPVKLESVKFGNKKESGKYYADGSLVYTERWNYGSVAQVIEKVKNGIKRKVVKFVQPVPEAVRVVADKLKEEEVFNELSYFFGSCRKEFVDDQQYKFW